MLELIPNLVFIYKGRRRMHAWSIEAGRRVPKQAARGLEEGICVE
jgi:hypothetical protein